MGVPVETQSHSFQHWQHSCHICNTPIMNVIQMITMLAVQIGFSYSSSWLPSDKISLTDSASHFQYNQLFLAAPYLWQKPCSPQPPTAWYQTYSHLSPHVAFFLWHGLGSSTHSTWNTGQKSFTDFNLIHPQFHNSDGSTLPTSQTALLKWVRWLRGTKWLQPKTIKSLSHMSHTWNMHMLMLSSHLLPVSHPCFGGSSEESRFSWASGSATVRVFPIQCLSTFDWPKSHLPSELTLLSELR